MSVAAVLQKDIALWADFSGRMEAVQRVEVRPRVAGALQAVHLKEGALVKQGDLLVTVDPAPYAAEVDRAEAQVAAAQARCRTPAVSWTAPPACCKKAPSPSASTTNARTPTARPMPTCALRRPHCKPHA